MNVELQEEKLPNKLNLGIWLKIGRYALESWPYLLLVLGAMLLTAYYDASFVPTMNAAAIEAVGNLAPSTQNVWGLTLDVKFIAGVLELKVDYLGFLLIEIGAILVRCLAIFVNFYFINILGMRIMTSLRRDSFKKVQELSFSYFDRTNSGWLIARMNNDTSSISDVLSWNLANLFWCLCEIVFTLVTMFSRDWKFSLIVLASVPIVLIIVPIFERTILVRWRTARNAYSHFVGWLAEAINGAKTIKTLAIEGEVVEESKEIIKDIEKKRWRAGKVNAFFNPSLSLISQTMVAIIVAVGISMIQAGQTEADYVMMTATVILFINFTGAIYNPLTQISEGFSEIMAAQAGAEKVGLLLDAKVEIEDSSEVIEKYGTIFEPKKENYEPIKGDIVYKDLTFSYKEGVEVIHKLNLHVKEGTSLAIVGETGSGKTTLVNLLCRFYEPTNGQVLIDGVDYKTRSLGWLRSNIGYVQQNPFVFAGTYLDNIRYGKEEATKEEIIEVSKIVGIHDFIMKEKNGYETHLEDGGNSLSQGQKQLISFARALIRNPRILILDEATSSIDTETEAEVQNALLKLLKGRTSISIAHRLSTIVNCDRILVMDDGYVVEDGSHKELMEKKGRYYELYMNQFKELSIESQLKTYEDQIEKKKVNI